MELTKIEELLEKYDLAETTLAEEAALKEIFRTQEVPANLECYRPFFGYLEQSKQESYKQPIVLPSKKRKTYSWLAIAAVGLIMFGMFWQHEGGQNKRGLDQLSHEELMAYQQTKEVFDLVSTKFNRGTNNLQALNLVSSKLNEGAENLEYLQEFNNTVEKLSNVE